jgi:hypothetical protein
MLRGAYVFIVERPGFRLTKTFYIVVVVVLVMTGSLGVLLTMHMHVNSKTAGSERKKASSNRAPNPAEIPECDLPPLPDREGPFEDKGHPYYLYPTGEVDGFAGREWWRVSLDEFKRHVDRVRSNDS